MKIIALPDLHEDIKNLETIADNLSDVDLVLLVGDLTNGSGATEAARVVNAVRQYNQSILAIPGNWDIEEVSEYLTQEEINIHRRHIIMDQVAFLGIGASLMIFWETPNEISESDFTLFLGEAMTGLDPDTPIVLVCHQPPKHTRLDKTLSGLNLGSKAVRDFIEKIQPLICFTGHIHEAIGIDKIGNTPIVNPGPLWEGGYAYVEIIGHRIEVLEIRKTA
jgi:Icc-related predicted phosphoesterase